MESRYLTQDSALIVHRLICARYLEKSVGAHEILFRGARIGFHGIDDVKFESEEVNAIRALGV